MTWRLRHGGGIRQRTPAQVAILSEAAPDILCLQGAALPAVQDLAARLGLSICALAPSRLAADGDDGARHTALLYRPSSLSLVGRGVRVWEGLFHHACLKATFRLADGADLTVYGTELSYLPAQRASEIAVLTEFAGVTTRGVLMGSMHSPDRQPRSWGDVPRHLQVRYRTSPWAAPANSTVTDLGPLRTLVAYGWEHPQTASERRTSNIVYGNGAGVSRSPGWCLDHILLRNLIARSYTTYDTPLARRMSDHLPVTAVVTVKTKRRL